ncbi:MAG TPA: hypothetical protein VFO58_10725 [Vicinamibacterales bacterium]|nr:hypothetical protein [Vicinamibacterales bacterium]
MRKALPGIVVAALLAVSMSDARPFGIDAWKIVLALFGLVLFVAAGPGGRRRT